MERMEDSESSLVARNENSQNDKSSPNVAPRDQSKKWIEFKKSMAWDTLHIIDIKLNVFDDDTET